MARTLNMHFIDFDRNIAPNENATRGVVGTDKNSLTLDGSNSDEAGGCGRSGSGSESRRRPCFASL